MPHAHCKRIQSLTASRSDTKVKIVNSLPQLLPHLLSLKLTNSIVSFWSKKYEEFNNAVQLTSVSLINRVHAQPYFLHYRWVVELILVSRSDDWLSFHDGVLVRWFRVSVSVIQLRFQAFGLYYPRTVASIQSHILIWRSLKLFQNGSRKFYQFSQ